MKWCFADAIALALDEKRDHPEKDFAELVNAFWAEMQTENEA